MCLIPQADNNWDATSLHQFCPVGDKTGERLMCFTIIKEKSLSFVWPGVCVKDKDRKSGVFRFLEGDRTIRCDRHFKRLEDLVQFLSFSGLASYCESNGGLRECLDNRYCPAALAGWSGEGHWVILHTNP